MRSIVSKEQKEKEKEYVRYKKIVRKMRRGKVEKINFEENSSSIKKRGNGADY